LQRAPFVDPVGEVLNGNKRMIGTLSLGDISYAVRQNVSANWSRPYQRFMIV
jgi:hypothetical protein